MYCHTPHPTRSGWVERARVVNAERINELQNADSGETLYIDVRYVVMNVRGETPLDAAKVRACHRWLNVAFRADNTDEIARVPNNASYPFRDRVGNPRIQFLPLDHNDLRVEYMEIDDHLDGSNPVNDAATKAGRVNGVLNVYIASSGHAGILGQAALGSNIVYVLHDSVGSPESPGSLPGYNLGKTLVHEVGHALSLVHTFSDTRCDDGIQPYPDVPEQVRPNYTGEIISDGQGGFTGRDDNRAKDRVNGTSTSCYSNADPTNEMFMNYLDYGDDHTSVMFTNSMALLMRDFLRSGGNGGEIELRSSDAAPYSGGGGTFNSAQVVGTEGSSGDSSTLLMWILIAAGVVTAIIIAGVYIRRSKTHNNSKLAQSRLSSRISRMESVLSKDSI